MWLNTFISTALPFFRWSFFLSSLYPPPTLIFTSTPSLSPLLWPYWKDFVFVTRHEKSPTTWGFKGVDRSSYCDVSVERSILTRFKNDLYYGRKSQNYGLILLKPELTTDLRIECLSWEKEVPSKTSKHLTSSTTTKTSIIFEIPGKKWESRSSFTVGIKISFGLKNRVRD